MNIKSREISVVVQGAVSENTADGLKSIRRVLPDAEIILSTWENENYNGLDYDILVTSNDPGSFPCDVFANSIPNNINRQLLSTKAGLEKASRKFVVKMRTDFYLKNASFIKYFQKYNSYDSKYKFFDDRVIACTVYSRNPRKQYGNIILPYCPSDFFFFGNLSDVKKLFQCQLITELYDQRYFDLKSEKRDELTYKFALCRYMPEQFIWIGFLKKYIRHLFCEHRDDINCVSIITTEKTFANNFVFVDRKNLGIDSYKKELFIKGIPENCYTWFEWYCIYLIHSRNKKINIFYNRMIKLKKLQWHLFTNEVIRKGKKVLQDKKEKGNIKRLHALSEVIKLDFSNIDYISFDLFDTLVFRRPAPFWVPMSQTGLYAAMLLNSKGYSISPERFNNLRNVFIAEDYENNIYSGMDEEYSFDRIIKKIITSVCDAKDVDHIAEKIIENELEREMLCLELDEEIFSVVKYLKENGKKVILTSDMYFSEIEIRKILQNKKIDKLFDSIYVSSEIGYTKKSGRLYQYVLSKENIDSHSMVHIGDNLYSDVKAAKKNGIVSYWYDKKYENSNKISRAYISPELADDYVRRLFFFKESSIETQFYNSVAIDINNAAFKIMIEARLRGINSLFFLERDGDIFYYLIKYMQRKMAISFGIQNFKLRRVVLSRKETACLINITNVERVIERGLKINRPVVFQITHILGCFGIDIGCLNSELRQNILVHNNSREYFKSIYMEEIYPFLRQRREMVLEYLDKNHFFDETIGLVDVGWAGTSQRDIMDYINDNKLKISCIGFYYGVNDGIAQLDGQVVGYCNADKLLYGYSFIEFVLKNYSSSAREMLQKVKENPRLSNTYMLNRISRRCILMFSRRFCNLTNLYALTPDMIASYSSKQIEYLIKKPKKEYLECIEGVKFSLDRKSGDTYLPLFEKSYYGGMVNKELGKAQWIQASLTYVDKKMLRGMINVALDWKNKLNNEPKLKSIIKKIFNYIMS